jgi:hypothetical protein
MVTRPGSTISRTEKYRAKVSLVRDAHCVSVTRWLHSFLAGRDGPGVDVVGGLGDRYVAARGTASSSRVTRSCGLSSSELCIRITDGAASQSAVDADRRYRAEAA